VAWVACRQEGRGHVGTAAALPQVSSWRAFAKDDLWRRV
jgi:hypothetical protein